MELRKFIATTIREYLNEQKTNSDDITEEIVAYHRSPIKFNKFNISNISNNSNRQLSGWGLYFSNIIPSKEYGEYRYKVNLFKDKKGYVLIDIKSSVQENIVNKIVELYKSGNDLKEISNILNISKSTIYYNLKKQNVDLRKPGPKATIDGNKVKELYLKGNSIDLGTLLKAA
jgi:hypothetical protein